MKREDLKLDTEKTEVGDLIINKSKLKSKSKWKM